tara:strand:+ start:179 stop:628 length:450 start_codon:yes stop_codon:yes gene_type:complete
MVAEILAGAALIKASIDAIKGTIASCKDVSEIAKDIDGLFQGQQDIARDKRQAKATGQSATQIVIAEETAKEDLKIAQELIIARFGYHAWQRILQVQQDQLLEQKALAAARKKKKAETQQVVEDAATVGISVSIGILALLIIVAVILAM